MPPEPFTNYFNYFTEIEEHFQLARGTSLFLLSPLDWALAETWKNSEVPLAAVLRGIDAAFEKWRSRRIKTQAVNSLAFCAQAVMTEAQRMADGGAQPAPRRDSEPFPQDDLRRFIETNAARVREAEESAYLPVADSLEAICAELPEAAADLEKLEQRLTVLEQKLIAIARSRQSEEASLAAREELERHLRPYRSKMTAPQLLMLQSQFLERNALDSAGLPRLSLFYLR